MDPEIVLKRGETILQSRFRRGAKGLRVWFKTHPSIEDIMRSWAETVGGQPVIGNTNTYGRYWIGASPLPFYVVQEGRGSFPFSGGLYRLDSPGQPLLDQNEVVNLSFLRLVGISENAGVEFTIAGVYSEPEAKRIQQLIGQASKRFYADYLLPVDLELTLSSQEVRV